MITLQTRQKKVRKQSPSTYRLPRRGRLSSFCKRKEKTHMGDATSAEVIRIPSNMFAHSLSDLSWPGWDTKDFDDIIFCWIPPKTALVTQDKRSEGAAYTTNRFIWLWSIKSFDLQKATWVKYWAEQHCPSTEESGKNRVTYADKKYTEAGEISEHHN